MGVFYMARYGVDDARVTSTIRNNRWVASIRGGIPTVGVVIEAVLRFYFSRT